ncbi:hypothetical protein Nepgr_016819 [Nepenthes gracilis]|uniref:Leucine-rich repeat-containing N-terminal plant-type domain-containing protein n=1 Tax=Nepenthes gracilis TaxID=150966 RepID=A0AAD3SP89_NEPGR|nr:hypothetical protein Nepgr_016819 [Nepenthes gracilis]
MAVRHLPSPLLFFLLILFHPSLEVEERAPNMNAGDLAALFSIRNSLTDLPGVGFFSTWDFASPDPCSFSGVTCSPSSSLSPTISTLRVTVLALGTGLSNSPGLAGSLSPALSNLTELTQLILFPGFVTGPIPPQLSRLTNLRVLSLTNNRLTGPLPTSLVALQNLHTLDLSFNQLSGSIPPGLTELTQLRVLVLASNQISGQLPDFLATSRLLHLDLKMNKLMGPLPSLPSTLRYLSVSSNAMWGPLNGLESLSDLEYLDLGMNRYSGPIPPSLFRPSLSSLFLQRNNFTGGIPVSPHGKGEELTPYDEGSIVDLSHNSLAGELPAVLAGVETLFLNNNRLSGNVPEEYVKSLGKGTMKTLYLQHNFFCRFPLKATATLPLPVEVCLAYNCMVPPVGLAGCPSSAGSQPSRPAVQCSVFHNDGNVVGGLKWRRVVHRILLTNHPDLFVEY